MHNTTQDVLSILVHEYPDEIDFLGQTVVENAIENIKMENTNNASNLDNSEILATIITAIGIIKPLTEIFALMYDRLKRVPTKAEVDKELGEKKSLASRDESDKYVDLLINYYLEKNRNAQ